MTGKFRAQTYAGGRALPLSNVSVTVRSSGGKLEAFRRTDINGFTDIIELQTPPEGFSLKPGEEQPYSQFDVTVEHPGYYGVLIKGVQVFAGRTTWQQVELLPLPEFAQPEYTRINITPGNL